MRYCVMCHQSVSMNDLWLSRHKQVCAFCQKKRACVQDRRWRQGRRWQTYSPYQPLKYVLSEYAEKAKTNDEAAALIVSCSKAD